MQSTTTAATINKLRHVVCQRGGAGGWTQRGVLFGLVMVLLQLFVTIIQGETDAGAAESTKILSRRRRYLTFPEGSSLQMGKEVLY